MMKDWHSLFRYDCSSGKVYRLFSNSNVNKIGDEVGSRLKNGYLHVRLDGSSYRIHRIVWEMHNGEIPKGMEIDHINHIRDDNRIENLRMVSRSENMKNRLLSRNNTSGHCGVTFDSARGKWVGQVWSDGKKKSKRFDHKCEAIAWRKMMNENLGFSKTHGNKGV